MSEAANETDMRGPLDFLLLEFPAAELTGAVAPELVKLVENGIIRLYDLRVISKSADGEVEAVELRDSPVAHELRYFAGASSGLIGDEEIREAASVMDPGTVGALLIYENSWAAPFVGAALRSGGQVIASGRIPATVLMDVLDTLEAVETADQATT